MSGTIFGVATRPLIHELVQVLGPHAVFMFADDTAVLVRNMGETTRSSAASRRRRDSPSSRPNVFWYRCGCRTPRVTRTRRGRAALQQVAGEWRDFAIRTGAKYLGFHMGRGVSAEDLWKKPLAKYEMRTREMSRSTVAPSACIAYFSQYVAPVLHYTTQLVVPNKQVEDHY